MAKKNTGNIGKNISVAEAKQILEKAVARERRNMKERNRRFNSLPKEEQRVKIAKDVLAQLANRRFVAQSGTYLEFNEKNLDDFSPSDSLKDVFAGEKCRVCGIGALFVAAVDRVNECTVKDLHAEDNDSFMRIYLNDWFDSRQLHMIEAAFERRVVAGNYSECGDAVDFADHEDDPNKRLQLIMENIVENDGEFVP